MNLVDYPYCILTNVSQNRRNIFRLYAWNLFLVYLNPIPPHPTKSLRNKEKIKYTERKIGMSTVVCVLWLFHWFMFFYLNCVKDRKRYNYFYTILLLWYMIITASSMSPNFQNFKFAIALSKVLFIALCNSTRLTLQIFSNIPSTFQCKYSGKYTYMYTEHLS